jgi:hypothetical protein
MILFFYVFKNCSANMGAVIAALQMWRGGVVCLRLLSVCVAKLGAIKKPAGGRDFQRIGTY